MKIKYLLKTINKMSSQKNIIIKNKGEYLEGTVIGAYYHIEYTWHKWVSKASGYISVMANNKIYTITDIDYNDEFKNLEKEIKDNFNNKVGYHINEIKIGIYVLDNKAIADFNTMKL